MSADGTAVRQYVYRNTAVEITPTRLGSERYDRSGWVKEWVRSDCEQPPPRNTAVGTGSPRLPISKAKAKHPPPVAKLTLADCPECRGFYRLVKTEPTPQQQGLRVIAKCMGPWCRGEERSFAIVTWCKGMAGLRGCTKCSAAIRRQERIARKDALRRGEIPGVAS